MHFHVREILASVLLALTMTTPAAAAGRCQDCATRFTLSGPEADCLALRLPRILANRGDPLLLPISACPPRGPDGQVRSAERLPSVTRDKLSAIHATRSNILCLRKLLDARPRGEPIEVDFGRCPKP